MIITQDYIDDGHITDIEIERNKYIRLEHIYRKLQSQYQQLEGTYQREVNDYSLRLKLEEKKYKAVVKIKDEEIKKWQTKYLNDSDKWIELKNKFENEIIRLKSNKTYDSENSKIIEKIKEDYQHLEEIFKEKDDECRNLQKTIDDKIKELNDVKNQLRLLQNDNEREKESSNRLNRIVSDLRNNASKDNELIKSLKKENLILKNNNENSKGEGKNKEILERIRTKEYASMKTDLKEKELLLEKEKTTTNKLNQQIISLKKALDNLLLENENLKNINSLQEIKKKDYKLNNDRYKEKLEESRKNINEKDNIIENLKEQIEKLSKELSEYDVVNNGLQQDLREHRNTISKLKKSLSEEEKITKEFSIDIDRIQKENDNLEKKINELKTSSDRDKSEIKIYHSLNEKLKKEIDEKLLLNNELKEQLEKSYNTNSKLKKDIESHYNSQIKLKEELDGYYESNDKLKKEIDNYYNENMEMKKKLDTNYTTIDKLKKDLDDANTEIDKLKGVLYQNKCENENKFKQTLLDVQEKITLLQQDLSNTITDNKNLNKKLEDSRNKSKRLQTYIDTLKTEKEKIQNNLTTLKEENGNISKV